MSGQAIHLVTVVFPKSCGFVSVWHFYFKNLKWHDFVWSAGKNVLCHEGIEDFRCWEGPSKYRSREAKSTEGPHVRECWPAEDYGSLWLGFQVLLEDWILSSLPLWPARILYTIHKTPSLTMNFKALIANCYKASSGISWVWSCGQSHTLSLHGAIPKHSLYPLWGMLGLM